ncbi:FHA domain-containing protein [Nocardioides marmorisolisilvae]|uniref:FHA domain-containing protein n=1 Tax=Nocardioides marmorisolisilvae TaxID=1542737 RepID=A0A3N0DXI4_9ACTN|nr:FHA domain-containing protein [Nocardioides marmorisolisilvae]RNL80163.1 FHA domain-containing protein [Nocardioides marmorisolisilvae]
MTTEVAADLRFSVTSPGRATVQGTVAGTGDRLEVRLSDPASFAGGRDAGHLRGLAAGLAARGITMVVIAGDTVLLEIGATHAPWWQRAFTRSRHLRVASVRGALTGALGRVRGSAAGAVLPGAELLPPTTLLPLAPTFGPSDRLVSTTHDRRRGGNPRLVLTTGNHRLPADRRVLFPLRGDATTIGSDAGCDIRLDGLAPIQAVVIHDDRDELVLHDRSPDSSTLVNGARVSDGGRVLRTGARVTVGAWILGYRRAEYADHGRPYGGRVGGELGHQRSQSAPRTAGST